MTKIASNEKWQLQKVIQTSDFKTAFQFQKPNCTRLPTTHVVRGKVMFSQIILFGVGLGGVRLGSPSLGVGQGVHGLG